jgi:hypothetical protein
VPGGFLEAAQVNHDLGRSHAAASDAVISGINSKDAICLRLTGRTRKSDNHAEAVAELKAAGPAGTALAPHAEPAAEAEAEIAVPVRVHRGRGRVQGHRVGDSPARGRGDRCLVALARRQPHTRLRARPLVTVRRRPSVTVTVGSQCHTWMREGQRWMNMCHARTQVTLTPEMSTARWGLPGLQGHPPLSEVPREDPLTGITTDELHHVAWEGIDPDGYATAREARFTHDEVISLARRCAPTTCRPPELRGAPTSRWRQHRRDRRRPPTEPHRRLC